ncbi:MAG: hypothetical protein CMK59_13300 [Proteobacteria bacterium]|nr:hypothetical protein [Pseudomonadota bacterium]
MWIGLALWLGCSDEQETKSDEQVTQNTEKKVASKPEAALVGSNVLFILMDTLRADRLGSYGYRINLSPNLDKLANEGVRFENHIANCSWTRPSMGAIFTGHYPRTLGLYEEKFDKLSEEFTTMAERFKAKGYGTYGVTSNPNTNALFGFAQGFDEYGEAGIVFKWMEQDPSQTEKNTTPNTDISDLENATTITDRAIALMDHAKIAESDNPYFFAVTYIDPHKPYRSPDKYRQFAKDNKSRSIGYDAGVNYADDEIGRLLTEMKSRGLLENTTIIFTSDHGEGLSSHPKIPDSRGHGTTLYDSNLHIPLFVHHPKLKPAVVKQLNSSIDLMPTWIDLFDLESDTSLPGVSLAPLIFGTGEIEHPNLVFAETEKKNNNKIGLRTPSHSYIINEDVIMYQERQMHEGFGLNKEERKMLEQYPKEEMYDRNNTTQYEVYTKNNIITSSVEDATELKKILIDWDKSNKERDPINRDPKDAFTLANGKKVFPYKDLEKNKQEAIDETTLKAMQQLGYIDEE